LAWRRIAGLRRKAPDGFVAGSFLTLKAAASNADDATAISRQPGITFDAPRQRLSQPRYPAAKQDPANLSARLTSRRAPRPD
jgi:hypothetical protein